jgi:hypothetical protein
MRDNVCIRDGRGKSGAAMADALPHSPQAMGFQKVN